MNDDNDDENNNKPAVANTQPNEPTIYIHHDAEHGAALSSAIHLIGPPGRRLRHAGRM